MRNPTPQSTDRDGPVWRNIPQEWDRLEYQNRDLAWPPRLVLTSEACTSARGVLGERPGREDCDAVSVVRYSR